MHPGQDDYRRTKPFQASTWVSTTSFIAGVSFPVILQERVCLPVVPSWHCIRLSSSACQDAQTLGKSIIDLSCSRPSHGNLRYRHKQTAAAAVLRVSLGSWLISCWHHSLLCQGLSHKIQLIQQNVENTPVTVKENICNCFHLALGRSTEQWK